MKAINRKIDIASLYDWGQRHPGMRNSIDLAAFERLRER